MKQTLDNEQQAIAYLFGELKGAERDDFEERLFLDEDFGLFINQVENDLIDDYVRGEMESGDKSKFENAYLTSETGRRKIRGAQILQEKLFDEKHNKIVFAEAPKASLWQIFAGFFRMPGLVWAGAMSAILVLLFGGIWFLNQKPLERAEIDNKNFAAVTPTPMPAPRNVNLPEDQSNTATEKTNINLESKTPNNVNQNLPSNSKTPVRDVTPPKPAADRPRSRQKTNTVPPPPKVFAFSLQPPLRSSKRPVLRIPAETQTVRLRLFDDFGEKYDRYFAELNDGVGKAVWSREFTAGKKRPLKSITINIPREKFKTGSYELAVSGITPEGSVEEINFYNFVVETK